MRKIQNANITFRVTNDLERLTEYCLESDCHNSVVIRHALASYLKAQREAELPRLMGSSLNSFDSIAPCGARETKRTK